VKILVFWDVMSCRISLCSVFKVRWAKILLGVSDPGGKSSVCAYQLAQHKIPKYLKLHNTVRTSNSKVYILGVGTENEYFIYAVSVA
jgi:hypothetical protein